MFRTIVDSINDVEEDSDNEVDANDPNASLQPRRKASESARNILMNWLVENEGKASGITSHHVVDALYHL